MKIAIISDTHDNVPNLEIFLNWAKENKIEILIHCGDIASAETVEFIANNFNGEVHLVYGNMDQNYRDEIYEATDNFTNLKLYGDEGELILPPPYEGGGEGEVNRPHPNPPLRKGRGELRIAFCHLPEVAKKMAESGRYNLVFYGHTHKPWLENIGKAQLINPGTLAGLFQKATFATYDTKSGKLELKILDLL